MIHLYGDQLCVKTQVDPWVYPDYYRLFVLSCRLADGEYPKRNKNYLFFVFSFFAIDLHCKQIHATFLLNMLKCGYWSVKKSKSVRLAGARSTKQKFRWWRRAVVAAKNSGKLRLAMRRAQRACDGIRRLPEYENSTFAFAPITSDNQGYTHLCPTWL